MKRIIIIVILLLLPPALLVFYANKNPKEKAAQDSFLGSPPATSRTYNVMDYTKPTK